MRSGETAVTEHLLGVHVWMDGIPALQEVGADERVNPLRHVTWQVPPLGSVVGHVPSCPFCGGVMGHDGSTHDMVEVIAPFTHVTSVPTVL